MPASLKNQLVNEKYFSWKLFKRGGVWQADGRGGPYKLGRHSLGCKDLVEARRRLTELDLRKATDLGLATQGMEPTGGTEFLPLKEGRRLYEAYINRPSVTGGLKASTLKKYKSHLDKLIPYLESRGVHNWNDVTRQALTDYASFLKAGGPASSKVKSYADKSICNELTFAKQLIKWLIEAGHLPGMEPIIMKLRKAESQRPYCWRSEEVAAMTTHCRELQTRHWLGDVIVALACTGLRISELAGLKWSDVDLEGGMISLVDETNRAQRDDQEKRRLKTGRSRGFPLHASLLEILRRRERQGRFVFRGPREGRLKPDTVRRVLIRDVLMPLSVNFPTPEGQQGFADGRLHSFRHYFCSTCANNGVPEQMLMSWLGHRDSDMVKHYYHLHDGESRRRMNEIDFLGGTAGVPLANLE